jgi:hypothetical protein
LSQLVILDTREQIRPLMTKLQLIPGLEWDDTDIVQRVLQSIQMERRAMHQLHDDCLELVSRTTGSRAFDMVATPQGWLRVARSDCGEVPWLNETVQIANALADLGAHLFHMLRSLGLYQQGYLRYQFKQWLGLDMVLERFELMRNPEELTPIPED